MCENSDKFFAQSVEVTNNAFTSRLTVNVSEELNGLSVECVHDTISSKTVIGTAVISLTTGIKTTIIVLL